VRLLLVEDDLELANGLAGSLAQSSYITDVVHTGQAAVTACSTMSYQLVILDLGLPDMDGVEVLRLLRRQRFSEPILILTARDDLQDRILGLDAGGDDYLSKPVAIGELEARVRALLRRGASASATLHFGKLDFEPALRQASVEGRELAFTASELTVLELLLRRPGRVVSKLKIYESLYPGDPEVNLSVVEVFVSRMRRKLEEASAGIHIRGLRGLGYRLELLPSE